MNVASPARVAIGILVVDDFSPWRAKISSMLSGQPNFQVIAEAADGFEAVQRARELKPHLILMDIGLPGLDGIEAARQIREISPACKILFIRANCSL